MPFLITVLTALGAGLSLPAEVLTDYRVRADFLAPLDADTGWAAPVNESSSIVVDQPFRLRLQVTSESGPDELRFYELQYRVNDGAWETALPADFPYPAYASPPVSVVKPVYPENSYTINLLPNAEKREHGEDSMGVGFFPLTAGLGEKDVATEFEWPLVVRYFADGPVRLVDGDLISFRLARFNGEVLPVRVEPVVTVRVPANHLGGTYVETPGSIGPWQAESGELFFIMEPTETDNRFMVVKSVDGGQSWHEADGLNRPPAGDLEAVDAALRDGILHMLHYEDVVWYHSFRVGEDEGWKVVSELVAEPEKPPVQSVGISARPDGSLVAFLVDGEDIVIRLRDHKRGTWDAVARIREGTRLSGIQVTTRPCGTATLAYTRGDGKAVARFFTPANELGPEILLSTNIGKEESDVGSIVRPVVLQERREISFLYREADGYLYERRLFVPDSSMGEPVKVSAGPVLQNPVDSDQAVADLVRVNGRLVVLYGCAATGNLVYAISDRPGLWSYPLLLESGISVSWVRAGVLEDGTIGYVYDAGSKGGSGMNRYRTLAIPFETH